MIFGKKEISTERPAFVMGILNATPDSFWKESRGGFDKAMALIKDGADILDIGGESTRPGYTEVSVDEELNRVIPLIQQIRKESDIVISVDTRKSSVMEAAIKEGADILNDVSALEDDENMVKVCAENDVSVILMHRFLEEESERKTNPHVASEVIEYLYKRAHFAIQQGVDPEKIIFDPGIGFGKTPEENISLIRQTDLLSKTGFPLLMALSRKRCIGQMTGRDVEERVIGTVAANMISVQKGAKIIRVHDVREAIDSLNIMKNLK